MSHSGSCASYSSEIRLNGQINQKLHWLNEKINYRDYTTMTVNNRLPMNGRLNGGTVNRCQPHVSIGKNASHRVFAHYLETEFRDLRPVLNSHIYYYIYYIILAPLLALGS